MDERRRQSYLQALGVESYFPRWLLPGAAPSPLCPETRSEGPVPEQEIPAPGPSTSPSASHGIQSLLTAEKPQSPRPAQPAAPADEPRQTVRFEFTVWRLGDKLLALESRQPAAALPTARLLENIATALGCGKPVRGDRLFWPRGGSPPRDDLPEAQAMVQTYLLGHAERQPFTQLLLLGPQVARYSLPPETVQDMGEALEQPGFTTAVTLEEPACQAIVIPGLVEMLRQPSLKAAAWQALQPFRVAPGP